MYIITDKVIEKGGVRFDEGIVGKVRRWKTRKYGKREKKGLRRVLRKMGEDTSGR